MATRKTTASAARQAAADSSASRQPRGAASAAASPSPAPRPRAKRQEGHAVAKAATAASIVRAEALKDAVQARPKGEDASVLMSRVQALLEGASPDEQRALRRALQTVADPQAKAQGSDPDTELAPGWRDGAYPYKHLLSRRSYEKQN